MNKIFVWQSYGDIKLYATDTTEQLREIIDTMVVCLRNWDMDDVLSDATQFLDSELSKSSRESCINMINKLIDEAGCDHESFEYCGFVKVKE